MANNTQAQPTATRPTATQQPQRHTIGTVFGQGLGAISSCIAMVDNAAKIGENVTGTLADKSANWREASRIADAIQHNELMAQYNEQAKELGLQNF